MNLKTLREKLADIAQGTAYSETHTRLKLEKLILEIEVALIDEVLNGKKLRDLPMGWNGMV